MGRRGGRRQAGDPSWRSGVLRAGRTACQGKRAWNGRGHGSARSTRNDRGRARPLTGLAAATEECPEARCSREVHEFDEEDRIPGAMLSNLEETCEVRESRVPRHLVGQGFARDRTNRDHFDFAWRESISAAHPHAWLLPDSDAPRYFAALNAGSERLGELQCRITVQRAFNSPLPPRTTRARHDPVIPRRSLPSFVRRSTSEDSGRLARYS